MDTNPTPYVVPSTIAAHPAWYRLESQRTYYSGKADRYQTNFKRIKLALICLSSAIPLFVLIPDMAGRIVPAVAGVLIAIFEGILLLNQYGELWIDYRATSESLKRERWLLLSRAGDYEGKTDDEALRMLASRTEALLQAQNADWVGGQKQALAQLAKPADAPAPQDAPPPPPAPPPDVAAPAPADPAAPVAPPPASSP